MWHVADSDELMPARIVFVAFVVATEIIFGMRIWLTTTITRRITRTIIPLSTTIEAKLLYAVATNMRFVSGRVASRQSDSPQTHSGIR